MHPNHLKLCSFLNKLCLLIQKFYNIVKFLDCIQEWGLTQMYTTWSIGAGVLAPHRGIKPMTGRVLTHIAKTTNARV